ncbi:MAG: hypothetical protein ABL974_23200 [Prosthecobacter sp.]
MMQRQGETFKQIGQTAGLGGFIIRAAAHAIRELEEEVGGVFGTEDFDVQGFDIAAPVLQAGGDENVPGGKAAQVSGKGSGGGFVIDVINDEEPVVMGGEPVFNGGDADGLIALDFAWGAEVDGIEESREPGVEPIR